MSVKEFLLTVWIYFTGTKVLCIPEVDYELSGPQCSRAVNFTCNALEFNSPRISWFAGDTVLATYNFIVTDVYPKEVMTESINAVAQISHANFTTTFNYFDFTLSVNNLNELIPFKGQNIFCGTTSMRSNVTPVDDLNILAYIATDVYPREVWTDSINATAQISNATFASTFNYFNFTLSTNLNELIPFKGQNIFCGTTSMRSNAIPVGNFEVLGNNLNVSLKVQYFEEQLYNITTSWTNSVYKCGIMTNFTIELTNLINESLIRQHFSSDMCHFNQCAASILSPPPSVKYFIYILARNQYAENQFTSKIEGHPTKYINYSFTNEGCGLQANCVAVNNEICVGRYYISEDDRWHAPIYIHPSNYTNLVPVFLASNKSYLVELYTFFQNTEILIYISYNISETFFKLPKVINATFTAMYWNNGHLFEARVAWNITQIFSCAVSSTCVQIQNSSGMILLEKRIFMDMCSNNLCTISFNIYKPTNDWVLYFKNDYTTADSIPSPTFIGSHHRSFIDYSLYFGTCYTSIQCITPKSYSCTIWLTNRLLFSMENSSSYTNYTLNYKLNHSTTYYVQVSTQINSTYIIYVEGNFTTPFVSNSSKTTLELFLVLSSLFLVTVGVFLTISYLVKLKKSEDSFEINQKIMALVIVCMLTLCFLSWLFGFVISIVLHIKSDICEDQLIFQARDILIKVSTILTGISVLTVACAKAVSKFILKQKNKTSQSTQEPVESGIYTEPSCIKEESVQMQVNVLYKIRSNKTEFAGADTIDHLEPIYNNINGLDL